MGVRDLKSWTYDADEDLHWLSEQSGHSVQQLIVWLVEAGEHGKRKVSITEKVDNLAVLMEQAKQDEVLMKRRRIDDQLSPAERLKSDPQIIQVPEESKLRTYVFAEDNGFSVMAMVGIVTLLIAAFILGYYTGLLYG